MTIPFVLTYSFEAVLKDGLSVFQNSRPNVVEVSKLFGLKIYFQTLSARCRTRSCLRSRVLKPLVVRLSPWQVLPPELCILHRNSSVSHFLFSLLRRGIFIISHLETGCQLLLYQINLTVKSFLDDGYIILGEMPENRRNRRIKLTEKGRRLCEDEIVPLIGKENAAMDGMSDAERDELARLLGVCCRGYCDGVRELI